MTRTMDASDRPVITGIGLFTPLGRGVDKVFEALCRGESGLRAVPGDHPIRSGTHVMGAAPELDAREVLPGPEGRLVDRFALMALAAAGDALVDAGITVGRDVDEYRTAVVIGSGAGGLGTFESQIGEYLARGRVGVSPYLLPGFLPNMAAARVAIKFGVRGFSSAPATACAAGAHAIADAVRLIRNGEADVVLCGGAEAPLTPTGVSAFANARALATGWEAEPAAASRPFDRRRNGFVLAEGAGIVVVERAAHARARGVSGYAELLGWGATTDAYRPTAPRPDGSGAAAAMRIALADAGLSAADVGHVNTHGTATKLGDAAEIGAIREVYRTTGTGPVISGVKSLTGHMLGASGAVELAVTALSLSRGLVPPTANLTDVDPACEADHVVGEPRRVRLSAALSNSFAFGGHNVSILLGAVGTSAR